MQTPKNRKLSLRRCVSTPENEKGPYFSSPFTKPVGDDDEETVPCTQEIDEDVDVIWDWNSPRPKRKYTRRQKKFDTSISPQVTTIRKHPSNGHIQKFDKLKEEITALRSQLVQPTQQAKEESNAGDDFRNILQDDSLDEDLVLCTQIVEKEVESNKLFNSTVIIVDEKILDKKSEKTFQMSVAVNNSIQKLCDDKIADDSLDMLLGRLEEPQIEEAKPQQSSFQSPFRKSKSFDEKSCLFQDFEAVSPIKCSPDEIEQKRLKALAKLEEKKKQELIERNRREAMKRLELSRKRRQNTQENIHK